MKKLLIGTSNPAKIQEYTHGLQALAKKSVQILTLRDLQIQDDPKETGKTFLENAELKAKHYAKLSGLPTLSDDGGLTIDVLNGEPGVYSRRWKGYEATDQELIDYTLFKLKGQKNRRAQMRLVMCVFNPDDQKLFLTEGIIEGHIANKPTKHFLPGFPFRALFIEKTTNKYYDELTEDEHHRINHRLMALRQMIDTLANYYKL